MKLEPVLGEDGFLEMQCKNISLGGACCISRVNFPVMTKLLMHIYIPSNGQAAASGTPLAINAYVVRSEKIKKGKDRNRYMLALFFQKMEESKARILRHFIEKMGGRGSANGKKALPC